MDEADFPPRSRTTTSRTFPAHRRRRLRRRRNAHEAHRPRPVPPRPPAPPSPSAPSPSRRADGCRPVPVPTASPTPAPTAADARAHAGTHAGADSGPDLRALHALVAAWPIGHSPASRTRGRRVIGRPGRPHGRSTTEHHHVHVAAGPRRPCLVDVEQPAGSQPDHSFFWPPHAVATSWTAGRARRRRLVHVADGSRRARDPAVGDVSAGPHLFRFAHVAPEHPLATSLGWPPGHTFPVTSVWPPGHTTGPSYAWPNPHNTMVSPTWPPNHATTPSQTWPPGHVLPWSPEFPPTHSWVVSQTCPSDHCVDWSQTFPPMHDYAISITWPAVPPRPQAVSVVPPGHDYGFSMTFPPVGTRPGSRPAGPRRTRIRSADLAAESPRNVHDDVADHPAHDLVSTSSWPKDHQGRSARQTRSIPPHDRSSRPRGRPVTTPCRRAGRAITRRRPL